MDYPANKTPTQKKKRRWRWAKVTAALLLLAVGSCYGLYHYLTYQAPNDQYAYWKNLMAKDPKPEGVSEAEYREKNRAGYCWRDRKFYRPEELQQKALISLSERMLAEIRALKENRTFINSITEEVDYNTAGRCRAFPYDCRLWLIPLGYTTDEWDKRFHTDINPDADNLPDQLNGREIKQPEDLRRYIGQSGQGGFTLNLRYDTWHNFFASDCCEVLTREQAEKQLQDKQAYLSNSNKYLPKNLIPLGIRPVDYGVGNFYLKTSMLNGYDESLSSLIDFRRRPSRKSNSNDVFFLNNCGDVLWLPYY